MSIDGEAPAAAASSSQTLCHAWHLSVATAHPHDLCSLGCK